MTAATRSAQAHTVYNEISSVQLTLGPVGAQDKLQSQTVVLTRRRAQPPCVYVRKSKIL